MSAAYDGESTSHASSEMSLGRSAESINGLQVGPAMSSGGGNEFSVVALHAIMSDMTGDLFSTGASLFTGEFVVISFPALMCPAETAQVVHPQFLHYMSFYLSVSTDHSLDDSVQLEVVQQSVSDYISPKPQDPARPPLPLPRPRPPP